MNRTVPGVRGVPLAVAVAVAAALLPDGAAAQPARTFTVAFSSMDSRYTFQVSVDDGDPCTTPCALAVAPGLRHVVARGYVTIEQDIVFPAVSGRVTVEPRLRTLVADLPPAPAEATWSFGASTVVVEVAPSVSDHLTIDGVPYETGGPIVIAPGRHLVQVVGTVSLEQSIDFPSSPSRLRIEHRDERLRRLGYVGLGVGGAVVGLGALFTWFGASGWEDPCAHDEGYCYNTSWYLGRLVVMASGVLVMAQGVILAAVLGWSGFGHMGENRIFLEPPSGAAREEEGAPMRLMSLGVAPLDRGAVLGASFAF